MPVYYEISPSPLLAPFVECLWHFKKHAAERAAVTESIFPDGKLDLLLIGEAKMFCEGGRCPHKLPASFLIGPQVGPIVLRSAGSLCATGVRFRPAGLRAFTRSPFAGFVGTVVPSDIFWGKAAAELTEQVSTLTPLSALSLLDRFLVQRLRATPVAPPRLQRALAMIEKTRGIISMSALARAAEISPRSMERSFREYLGVSAKHFSRVRRFDAVKDTLLAAPSTDPSDLACEFAYFDQSHLIREFRQFAGCTPGEFACAAREGIVKHYR
jgi:AraC-like DNA-binding protein